VDNGDKVASGDKADNAAKVHNPDKVDRSDRRGSARLVCSKPLLFRTTGESIWFHPSLQLTLLLQHPRSISA
jgi:hypothetical protein